MPAHFHHQARRALDPEVGLERGDAVLCHLDQLYRQRGRVDRQQQAIHHHPADVGQPRGQRTDHALHGFDARVESGLDPLPVGIDEVAKRRDRRADQQDRRGDRPGNRCHDAADDRKRRAEEPANTDKDRPESGNRAGNARQANKDRTQHCCRAADDDDPLAGFGRERGERLDQPGKSLDHRGERRNELLTDDQGYVLPRRLGRAQLVGGAARGSRKVTLRRRGLGHDQARARHDLLLFGQLAVDRLQAHLERLRLYRGFGHEHAEVAQRLALAREARAQLLERGAGIDVVEARQVLREHGELLAHPCRLGRVSLVEEDPEGVCGLHQFDIGAVNGSARPCRPGFHHRPVLGEGDVECAAQLLGIHRRDECAAPEGDERRGDRNRCGCASLARCRGDAGKPALDACDAFELGLLRVDLLVGFGDGARERSQRRWCGTFPRGCSYRGSGLACTRLHAAMLVALQALAIGQHVNRGDECAGDRQVTHDVHAAIADQHRGRARWQLHQQLVRVGIVGQHCAVLEAHQRHRFVDQRRICVRVQPADEDRSPQFTSGAEQQALFTDRGRGSSFHLAHARAQPADGRSHGIVAAFVRAIEPDSAGAAFQIDRRDHADADQGVGIGRGIFWGTGHERQYAAFVRLMISGKLLPSVLQHMV